MILRWKTAMFVTEIHRDRFAFYIVYPAGHGIYVVGGRTESQPAAYYSEVLILLL